MPYIYVDVELSEFETDELKGELTSRGFLVLDAPTSIPLHAMSSTASGAEQVAALVDRLHYALAGPDDQGAINALAADLCRLLSGRVL